VAAPSGCEIIAMDGSAIENRRSERKEVWEVMTKME
jgi:hypothetical protein